MRSFASFSVIDMGKYATITYAEICIILGVFHENNTGY